MSQLKKGAILSYGNILLTNIIGLVITPFMIKALGDSEYGLYTLIGSLVTYFSLMDFGLNNTIIRFVAKYRAEKDKKGEENFLVSILLIYLAISLVVFFLGVWVYFNLENLFGQTLTIDELYKAKIMFIILIFNVVISIPGGSFFAISSGYEKFVYPRVLIIIKYLVRSASLVIVLIFDGDAVSIVILDTIVNVVFLLLNGIYVFRNLKVKFKLHFLSKSLFREIFTYSIWIFALAIFSQFQWKSGQLVLGMLKDTTTVAIYGVGIMLGTYYGSFASAISSLLLPKATKMLYGKYSKVEISNMFTKIGRITVFILFIILGGFALFGKQFVLLWLGENYIISWKIALLIMVAITIPLSQSFANSILEASQKLKFKVFVSLSFMTIGIAFGSFLVKDYGGLGMIVGILLGRVLSELALNIFYMKVIQLNVVDFFKKVYLKNTLIFIVVLLLGYLINEIPGEGWLNFIIKISIYSTIFFVAFYKFALIKEEKYMFKKMINLK
jgi:O-antigen/teichoic acid export membrane protein